MQKVKLTPLDNKERVRRVLVYLRSPILDVGCSFGDDMAYFARLGHQMDGCEVDSGKLAEASRRYPHLNFSIHDFQEAPIQKKYGSIYAFDVIEHVHNYPRWLTNIRASLGPDGILVLTTPNVLGLKNRIGFLFGAGGYFLQMEHIRYFTPSTLTQALKEAGFEVLETHGYSSVPLPVSLCGSLTVIAKAGGTP